MNGTFILKSGSDFHQYSKIMLDFKEKELEIQCLEVTKDLEPDEEVVAQLEKFKGMTRIYALCNINNELIVFENQI